MSDLYLDIRTVTKRFGELEACKDVSLQVKKGEVVSIIGPSGSGKSTLLRCVNQLEIIDGGEIQIEGEAIISRDSQGSRRKLPDKQVQRGLKKLGMVFQHFNLFPHRSVIENLIEAPLVVEKAKRAEIELYALELLEKVGLADKADAYPSRLSGGQKQRLALSCSASIALLFARSERLNLNRYAVTSINYAVAAAAGIATGIGSGAFSYKAWSVAAFIDEFPQVVLASEGRFSPPAGAVWALLIGLVTGWLFVTAFLLYQLNVRQNGPSLSGMFGKLGILLPVLLSLLVWREFPGALQWTGIALALAALMLPSLVARRSAAVRSRRPGMLILLFLGMGLAEFSNKLFEAYAPAHLAPLFLTVLFCSALIASILLRGSKGGRIGRREIIFGCAVGVPNLFSSFFLIRALRVIPAAVAFPFYSVGSMLLIVLGGGLLFRERLQRSDYIGVTLAALALILLS